MAVFVRLSPEGGLAAVPANRRRAARPVTSPPAKTGAARRPGRRVKGSPDPYVNSWDTRAQYDCLPKIISFYLYSLAFTLLVRKICKQGRVEADNA